MTLPQFFKSHGYHTQCVGKIFHNWRQDEWKGDSVSWSVPSRLHYNSHGRDKPQVDGVLPANLASGVGGMECRDVSDEAYFDGRVATLASRVLRECAERENPFFLAVGFWKPHTPFNAPRRNLPSWLIEPLGSQTKRQLHGQSGVGFSEPAAGSV